jgi:large subunit ribosomal protein L15
VNIEALNRFPAGSLVDPAALATAGLIRSRGVLVKVLGDGTLSHPLKVKANRFSKSALEKITKAGGTAERVLGTLLKKVPGTL